MPIIIALAAVLAGASYYAFTPQLSLASPGLLILLAALTGGVGVIGQSLQYERRNGGPAVLFFGACALCIVALLGGMVMSMPMLHAEAYHNLLGQEKDKEFKHSLPPIDLENAPLVSSDMAMRAAEKKLSEIPALGSQTKVGHLEKQLVNGKLVYIGFLQHRGLFSWNSQGTTPGYVRVSATDPSDVELVTHLGDKKLAMRYLDSGYFGDDLERHMRFNGYATKGLKDFSPEIDDEGRPFAVVSVFERRIGFDGHDAVGVAVVDVQTGDIKYYPTADVPKWVDRVEPEAFVKEQVEDRLEYVHGWLNPSHKDKLAISGDVDLVYGKDGRAYFFAGMVSTAKEGGLVGFMLIDSRTKETTRYTLTGVTEPVARAAAEGVLPEKHYSATNALPFMVEGVPAYVMALKDSTGIARAYGIVSIADYQKVAVGDSLVDAARKFQNQLNRDRTQLDAGERPDEMRVKGTVTRIGSEVRTGTTNYVLMLSTSGKHLYTADINRSEDLVVTKEGDLVEIRTLSGEQHTRPILEFKNLTVQPPTAASAPTAAASAAR
jgi:hypothetical protein